MPNPECRAPTDLREAEKVIRADWVAPMDGPLIRDGAVAFRGGTILGVGAASDLLLRFSNAETFHRPGNLLLPGLVNAHTHLELSEFSSGKPPADFVDWVVRLVPRGPLNLRAIHESVARSVPLGVRQCLRFGVTCVGDISRHCTITRPLLTNGPLRVVSYGEIQAMAQRRGLLEERLSIATDAAYASSHLRIGLSPHAPYSVEAPGYERCLRIAGRAALPLATHLAETAGEAPFLADHTGRFRELWDGLGAWDDDVPTYPGGPIRFAESLGLLHYRRTLLAHVNYCDDAELDLLARGTASVAYCPRTHAYFGHPPHRWREMLARGINVAVGTDSCASSPDLNLVEELRLLRKIAPAFPAEELWKLATTRAARALDEHGSRGSLRAGAAADFVVFPAEGNDPLQNVLDSDRLPLDVWIGGEKVGPQTMGES